MNTVEQIVAVHDGPDTGFLNGLAECREVNLIECTLVNVTARVVAVPLLIVGGKVLHCGDYTARLHTFYIFRCYFRSEIRILAHVLKVATTQWRTVNVDTRAK